MVATAALARPDRFKVAPHQYVTPALGAVDFAAVRRATAAALELLHLTP